MKTTASPLWLLQLTRYVRATGIEGKGTGGKKMRVERGTRMGTDGGEACTARTFAGESVARDRREEGRGTREEGTDGRGGD